MAAETQLLWIVTLGIAEAVLGVVVLLLGLLRAGARDVAGHLTATTSAANGLEAELDALLRP